MRTLSLFALSVALFSFVGSAGAQLYEVEDTYIVDADRDALIEVNGMTGNRRVVSGCVNVECTAIQGTGPNFQFARGIIFETYKTAIVCDGDLDDLNNIKTIFRVDLLSGNRFVISSSDPSLQRGSGPAFDTLFDVILDANGMIIAADTEIDTIFRVHPLTGDRTILSSNSVGTGPQLGFPGDMVLEDSGMLLSTEGSFDMVLRIDPVTGNRTIVSSSNSSNLRGDGISLQNLGGITIDPNGDILVADAGQNAVIKIDPVTGDRTEVSGPGVGDGPSLNDTFSLDVDSEGTIYVADGMVGLVRIDPVTGDREIYASGTVGDGMPLSLLRDARVEGSPFVGSQVPAISPIGVGVLALMLGGGAVLHLRRRRALAG
jgi:hypothetical protein